VPKQQKSRQRKQKKQRSERAARPSVQQPKVATQPQRSLKAFVGLTLLLLGPAFAVWYVLGSVVLTPVAWLADLILPLLYPHAIEAVELQSGALDIVTQFDYTPPGTQVPAGVVGQYVISLNGLKYGYGLPLLLALILASPGPWLRKLGYSIAGFVLIVLVQVWGVSFETLISLIFKSDQSIALQMGSTALGREFLALGYQLGYLILPAVTPLIFWGLTHYAFLQTLLQRK